MFLEKTKVVIFPSKYSKTSSQLKIKIISKLCLSIIFLWSHFKVFMTEKIIIPFNKEASKWVGFIVKMAQIFLEARASLESGPSVTESLTHSVTHSVTL